MGIPYILHAWIEGYPGYVFMGGSLCRKARLTNVSVPMMRLSHLVHIPGKTATIIAILYHECILSLVAQ